MDDTNYIVKFLRRDNQPDEEYIYWNQQDAKHHFELFRHDNSNIYKKIMLLLWNGKKESIIGQISFA